MDSEGYYEKYKVTKIRTGKQVKGFFLDFDDSHGRKAALHYATITHNKKLYSDLVTIFDGMLKSALEVGIDIWQNNALGVVENRSCPLCILYQYDCYSCRIHDCFDTPFGAWCNSDTKEDTLFYADEMVNYLMAVKNGWESEYYYWLFYSKEEEDV